MHFALTSEQELARSALRELLAEHCSAKHLRRVFEADQPARVTGLWTKLHELGVIGALAPEAVGGLGLDAIDLTVLLEETGRAAVPELVVETAAAAVPLLAALPDSSLAARTLQRILAGELSVTIALGTLGTLTAVETDSDRTSDAHSAREASAGNETSYARSQRRQPALVPDAELAGLMLCAYRGELHLLDPRCVELRPVQAVDRARRMYAVDLEASVSGDSKLANGALAQQLLAAAHDHAALGTAAQLIGLGHRMLELTIEHVKTRKQFGQAIGAFQAVKHQLVDARLALEFAAPLVYRAAHSVAHAAPERSLHVSMAKAFASEAALLAARKALQLHGAIGYSYEYELQLYMKRAWALAAAHGDALAHRTRIAEIMLDGKRPTTAQGERHA